MRMACIESLEVSLFNNMKLGIEPTIGHNNLIRSYAAFYVMEKST